MPALQRASRSELRWAAAFAAAFMLLTCLPYLFGLYLRQPGWYYSGFLTNPDEHNVYLSLMRQARDGQLFFSDQFTSEPGTGRVISVFWLALGLFARGTHLPLPIVYHLARLLSGWLLLVAIYWLAAQSLTSLTGRKVALVLTATASGFGWLYHAQGGQPHPVDFGPGLVMPEAITFLTLLLNPLFAISMFLMVASLGLADHALRSGSTRAAVLAGLAALALGNIHSYDLIPVAGVLGAYLGYLLIARGAGLRAVLLAFLVAAIASPSVLYQLWLQRSGEVSVLVKTIGQPPSPAPIYLILGLGLPLLLAVVGAARSARGNDHSRLLVIWLILGFALAYSPLAFQRKLVEGLHIPVCLLAASALEPVWAAPAGRRAGWLGLVLVLIAVPSNALYVRRALGDLVTNNQAYLGNLMPPLYLRPDQYGALRWLDANAARSEVLLANTFLSSYAPSLAGVRVYAGHWSETLRYRDKIRDLARFLQADRPEAEKEALCRQKRISYVLRDHSVYDDVFLLAHDQVGAGFDPDGASWLFPLFMQGQVALYRVLTPGGPRHA